MPASEAEMAGVNADSDVSRRWLGPARPGAWIPVRNRKRIKKTIFGAKFMDRDRKGLWFATACADARLRCYGNGQRPGGAFPEGRNMVTAQEYADATALLAGTLMEVPAVDFAPSRDLQRIIDRVCRSLGSTSFPTRAKRAFVFAGWDGDAHEERGGNGHATNMGGQREGNRRLCDGYSSPLLQSHRRIFPSPLCGQGHRAHARLRIQRELRRDSGVRGEFEGAPQ
jgi:hypothetical protein